MTTALSLLVRKPTTLAWWQVGKLLGAVLLCLVAGLLVTGVSVHPFVLGLVLHVALDFSLQSNWVTGNKSKGGSALIVHSVIAGGLPPAIAGLLISPQVALAGAVVGIVTHYAIDRTNKFGLPVPQGATLDQVAHIAVVVVLLV